MHDVVIVGAGAAGIGCGVVLRQLGVKKFTILDREHTGASFDRWPEEMRFITPSFTSNAFGSLDLNAVAPATSPAYTLKTEHPSGKAYGSYLRGVREYFDLPVRRNTEVQRVDALKDRFRLHTARGLIYARQVIWAAGEFQYPNPDPFPGAELCLHTSRVTRWAELKGDEFVIIGGYESGADAAIHLSARGKRVTVLDSDEPWARRESDPSVALSPYTCERLAAAGSVCLIGNTRIAKVEDTTEGYRICAEDGRSWDVASRPLLATGFLGGLSRIQDLLDWTEDGDVVLTENDESTRTPGLFVAGPQLRHQKIIFCFIYKFRQRFAVIGNALAQRLDLSPEPLERYREAGIFLDDLRCCKAECAC